MTITHDPTEDRNADGHDGAQSGIPRLIGAAFKRERRRTEKLLDGLLFSLKMEIGNTEERISDRLDQIDTSLNLIAQELLRNDPKLDDRG